MVLARVQEALEQCRALRNSEEAHQHVALGACTQRALALVSSKAGASSPESLSWRCSCNPAVHPQMLTCWHTAWS